MAGASTLLIAAPAFAQTTKASAPPPPDPRVGLLEQELRDVQQQLADIKKVQDQARDQAQAQLDNTAALADLKRSTSSQYADLNSQLAATEAGRAKVTVNNGRLEVTSADGRFSAAVRGLLQYDAGFYSQSHAANSLPSAYGSDFSSGDNFRRVYLGLSGKVFGDWTYNLNFDFGGSGGTETPGHIQSVYLEYDGLAPWALRVGAYPPPTNVEDGTSSGDVVFLERNSPSDMQRNLAGGDGRDAISLLYLGERLFGALSYTGDKIGDGAKALAAAGATAATTFNEQQAVVGRLAWLPIYQEDAHWLIGVNGTYIIKPPNAVANGLANLATTPGTAALNAITLSDPPELTVDSNGYTLANTTALEANHLTQWGVETAGNWNNFYGQAGYYNFAVDRTPVAYATPSGTQIVKPSNDTFSGWYAQATWVLTGEARVYNNSIGAFTPPRPTAPFDLANGQWGAFELVARYSDLDLNDHVNDTTNIITATSGTSHTYDYYNTVRGGDQRILTLGFNWYPNNVVRFDFNYELDQNSRLESGSSPNALTGLTATTAGVPALPAVNGGQNMSTFAIRAQLSL